MTECGLLWWYVLYLCLLINQVVGWLISILTILIRLISLFLICVCDAKAIKSKFGKWCPWYFPLISNGILKNKWWFTDIFCSSFFVSLGSLLLRFLLCFSPTLPRISDYWVRYKLWLVITCQESFWLPRFSGISSVLKHCRNARRGKCESSNYCNDPFRSCV